MANDTLELLLKEDEYTQNIAELTVYIYQYLMANMEQIQEEKPHTLERVYKFKLLLI